MRLHPFPSTPASGGAPDLLYAFADLTGFLSDVGGRAKFVPAERNCLMCIWERCGTHNKKVKPREKNAKYIYKLLTM